MHINEITEQVIGAAIEVHRELGPGLLESAYEECLARELALRQIPFERQKAIPVTYKGRKFDAGFRADMIVADQVLVELKAVESIVPIHEAQVLTYLKLAGLHVGLLINFNVPVLAKGIRRFVNGPAPTE
ncbi:MAG TPA: GxxExxY protein [Armatimonadota bacterium]|nr:GxxExxY protein [Armatimonadota bacterium]